MGGWTLEYVSSLDSEAYATLVHWINDTSRGDDPDDLDMDAFIAAKKAADAHGR